MKGRWESNIRVWFPFMCSQKWICYFQTRIIMFCLPIPIHSYICERFIYFQDRSAYSAAGKYVARSWEYMNRSQTHECGKWDKGCAIPGKGIYKTDFPCSVVCTSCKGVHKVEKWGAHIELRVFLWRLAFSLVSTSCKRVPAYSLVKKFRRRTRGKTLRTGVGGGGHGGDECYRCNLP